MLRSVRPRLVTFDVTGTLLMTKLEEHYTEIGSQHGITLDPQKLSRSFKVNFQRLSLEHPVFGKHTGLGWENWWRTIVHNVFKEQHHNISDSTLDKVASSLIRCYGTSVCWHKYPGTIELLEYLREMNLILGVISNFDERLQSILVSTQIRNYFSFVLSSYNFGKEKPCFSIFHEALRLSMLHQESRSTPLKPEEAIHIGDSVSRDYLGAKHAGWNAFLIRHHDEPVDESKVAKKDVFGSLQKLQSHLRDILLNTEQCRIGTKKG